MKMKHLTTIIVAALSLSALSAQAYDGSRYAHEARISLHQAEKIAKKAYPGTIVEVALRHERGGSGLRYSFDVRGHHRTHEIAVDAKTGRILRNERESEHDDD